MRRQRRRHGRQLQIQLTAARVIGRLVFGRGAQPRSIPKIRDIARFAFVSSTWRKSPAAFSSSGRMPVPPSRFVRMWQGTHIPANSRALCRYRDCEDQPVCRMDQGQRSFAAGHLPERNSPAYALGERDTDFRNKSDQLADRSSNGSVASGVAGSLSPRNSPLSSRGLCLYWTESRGANPIVIVRV